MNHTLAESSGFDKIGVISLKEIPSVGKSFTSLMCSANRLVFIG